MIKLCVFDLGGTIVDKYSLSPFLSLKNAFKNKGINIHNSLLFKDMGKSKLDHINLILNDKYVSRSWFQKYGKYPNHSDPHILFEDFNQIQLNNGLKQIRILPETKQCFDLLGENNILTGVTTGFNHEITMKIKEKIIDKDIYIHKYVSSTCMETPSRPFPHMIHHIMNELHIDNPNSVIKIDDTEIGIKEGINAGCTTVGVAKWSINMKMKAYEEAYILTQKEYDERLKYSRFALVQAGADHVIDSLDELYPLIHRINNTT
jgi:phosphonoacetaldehyde hydrolase